MEVSSKLETILHKLHYMEENLIVIILEAALKISKLTDNRVFVLVESSDNRRKVFGDFDLVTDFQNQKLKSNLNDQFINLLNSNEDHETLHATPVDEVNKTLSPNKKSLKRRFNEVQDADLRLAPCKNMKFNTDFTETTPLISSPPNKGFTFSSETIELLDELDHSECNAAVEVDRDSTLPINCSPPNFSETVQTKRIYKSGNFILNAHVGDCNPKGFIGKSRKAKALKSNSYDFNKIEIKNTKEFLVNSSLIDDTTIHFFECIYDVPDDDRFFTTAAVYLTDCFLEVFPEISQHKKYLCKSFINSLRNNSSRNVEKGKLTGSLV